MPDIHTSLAMGGGSYTVPLRTRGSGFNAWSQNGHWYEAGGEAIPSQSTPLEENVESGVCETVPMERSHDDSDAMFVDWLLHRADLRFRQINAGVLASRYPATDVSLNHGDFHVSDDARRSWRRRGNLFVDSASSRNDHWRSSRRLLLEKFMVGITNVGSPSSQ